MWQEIVVIVLIICAIGGIAWSIYRQRNQRCEGSGGCKDCPLAKDCKKEERKQNF